MPPTHDDWNGGAGGVQSSGAPPLTYELSPVSHPSLDHVQGVGVPVALFGMREFW